MKKVYIIVMFVAALAACSGSRNDDMYNSLAKADSLLMKEMPDSALKELTAMGLPDDNDRKCRAYYSLLLTQARYLLDMSADSTAVIDNAVSYYEETDDKEKLARALHWKAGLLIEAGRHLEAIEAEKGAEANVNVKKAPMLAMRIYDAMTWLNEETGNYRLAKDYAFKQLRQAEILKDKKRIAAAHYGIACDYTNLENSDSALYHIEKSLLLMDHAKTLKPSILYQAAVCCRNTDKWDEAEKYVRKSMDLEPRTDKDVLLGDIYIHTGRADEGVTILQKVLPELDRKEKWVAMQLIEDVMMKRGRYAEAAKLQEEITLLKDSLAEEKKAAEALEVQKKYEKGNEKEQSGGTPWKTYLRIGVGVLCIMAATFYILYTRRNEKKERDAKEIARLNEEKEKKDNEIARLNEKLGREKKKIAQAIARGKELNEKIDVPKGQQQRVITGNGDYADFVEYYRTIKPEYIARMEKKYKNITPYSMFILIMQEQYEYDDRTICIICGIQPNALRMQKSRTVKKSDNSKEQK